MHRRWLVLAAAGAVATAAALTGCSARTDGVGTVGGAGRQISATTASCTAPGFSAGAASRTVQCYFDALRTRDTAAACRQLSDGERDRVLARVRSSESAQRLMTLGDTTACGAVAAALDAGLERLDAAQRARFDRYVASARVVDVAVSGATAAVTVSTPATGRFAGSLVRQDGGWKIDSGALAP